MLGRLVLTFALASVARAAGATPACQEVHFKPGGTAAIISGRTTTSARPNCYAFRGSPGQTVELSIIGDHVAASVPDVQDDQDHFRFQATGNRQTFLIFSEANDVRPYEAKLTIYPAAASSRDPTSYRSPSPASGASQHIEKLSLLDMAMPNPGLSGHTVQFPVVKVDQEVTWHGHRAYVLSKGAALCLVGPHDFASFGMIYSAIGRVQTVTVLNEVSQQTGLPTGQTQAYILSECRLTAPLDGYGGDRGTATSENDDQYSRRAKTYQDCIRATRNSRMCWSQSQQTMNQDLRANSQQPQ